MKDGVFVSLVLTPPGEGAWLDKRIRLDRRPPFDWKDGQEGFPRDFLDSLRGADTVRVELEEGGGVATFANVGFDSARAEFEAACPALREQGAGTSAP